jgi:hypothetical protein
VVPKHGDNFVFILPDSYLGWVAEYPDRMYVAFFMSGVMTGLHCTLRQFATAFFHVVYSPFMTIPPIST